MKNMISRIVSKIFLIIIGVMLGGCSTSVTPKEQECSEQNIIDRYSEGGENFSGLLNHLKNQGYAVLNSGKWAMNSELLFENEFDSMEFGFIKPLSTSDLDSIAHFRASLNCSLKERVEMLYPGGEKRACINRWTFKDRLQAGMFVKMELIKDHVGYYYYLSSKKKPKHYIFQNENQVYVFPNSGEEKDRDRALILEIKKYIGQQDSSYIKFEYD